MRPAVRAILTVAFLAPRPAPAVPPSLPIERTPAEQTAHDEKMVWWRDARCGMFIHCVFYAVPAGTYDGRRIPRHRRVDHETGRDPGRVI